VEPSLSLRPLCRQRVDGFDGGTRMAEVMVIGGGLTGLAAAIECAERGLSVELREATGKLGGRARSLAPDGFVTNQGPHALYLGGPGEAWLRQRSLLPELVAQEAGVLLQVRHDGKTCPLPAWLRLAIRDLHAQAPDGVSFAEWARSQLSPRAAALVEGLLTLLLFDGDPGRYAASFVREVLAQGPARYVIGGWGQLVDGLVARARALGVELRTGSRVERIEQRQTIVCTGPEAAGHLLGEPGLRSDGQRVALRDVGLESAKGSPGGSTGALLLELDEGVYIARYSALDPSLAPPGHDLLQCCAGLRPGESTADAHQRIQRVLEVAYPDWRERTLFDRPYVVTSPGARDPVGSSWRARPAIERGDGVLLAGDWVAAQGFLSEVCFTSAAAAAERVAQLVTGRGVMVRERRA
jgi:phytoene dehydrogenase-like protein